MDILSKVVYALMLLSAVGIVVLVLEVLDCRSGGSGPGSRCFVNQSILTHNL